MDAAKTKWDNHYDKDMDRLHVTPAQDSIPHCPAETCYCKPSLELIQRGDNSVGAVYLHRVLGEE